VPRDYPDCASELVDVGHRLLQPGKVRAKGSQVEVGFQFLGPPRVTEQPDDHTPAVRAFLRAPHLHPGSQVLGGERLHDGWLDQILKCPELTQLVRPFMSYGKDERDIDKHVWKLPIPLYDPADEAHRRLSELGKLQADTVAALELDQTGNFVTLRQRVRDALASHGAASEISDTVTEMLA
jgi:hypothetical protein